MSGTRKKVTELPGGLRISEDPGIRKVKSESDREFLQDRAQRALEAKASRARSLTGAGSPAPSVPPPTGPALNPRLQLLSWGDE
jgi:hypothetical protein